LRECGQAESEEYSSRTKSGEIRTMLLSAEPINIAGEPCIIAVTMDITERKQAEKALRESEEKFSAAFRASPGAISITTLKDGIFLDVNDSFTRINGYTREEVIGRSSKELKIWAKPEERDRILRALREHGRAVNEEYSSRTKSGEIRTMLLSAEPIKIAGEPCIIAVTTDVTERKQTRNESRVNGDSPEGPVHEPSSEPTGTNRQPESELDDREKVGQALLKARSDIEMANRVNS
jgi:PAS domain S-box-containing protein